MGFAYQLDADGGVTAVTLRPPAADTHKYRRGGVWVMSGPPLATGASRLAAQAALGVGAGVVTLVGERAALVEHAAQVTAIMLREAAADVGGAAVQAAQDGKLAALAIGPAHGVGVDTRAAVLALLATGLPMVLDADALTSFAGDPSPLFAALHPRAVLTPHAGEFARLFPAIDTADRVAAARAAAQAAGAVVLLKGAHSVIAAPDGRRAVNRYAHGWLATAGSGDVLTGMIAGLLAQRSPAFDAACIGAWLHGAIAIAHGPGLTADRMIGEIAGVLRGVLAADTQEQSG